jgi:hypothetical protein
MTVTIGRRELLAALGGAAVWSLAARAPLSPPASREGLEWRRKPQQSLCEASHLERRIV